MVNIYLNNLESTLIHKELESTTEKYINTVDEDIISIKETNEIYDIISKKLNFNIKNSIESNGYKMFIYKNLNNLFEHFITSIIKSFKYFKIGRAHV